MSPAIEVVEPGFHTTVQDLGRATSAHWGVPRSGALDSTSMRLANSLVGNAFDEAAFEMLHTGARLAVAGAPIRIALAAYGGRLEISGGRTISVEAWRSLDVLPGDLIEARLGDRAAGYLAVGGGFDLPTVLGSRSTCVRLGLGGWRGRSLVAGDSVPIRGCASTRTSRRLASAPTLDDGPIRVVLGPQHHRFSDTALARFASAEFAVSAESDRMGLRLTGEPIEWRDEAEMLSDGIVPGAIQVPAHGQPVLLLADCQTTGGYPKIATVCTADLGRAGQLRPGDRVRFVLIDVAAATARLRAREREVHRLIERARPARAPLDTQVLTRANVAGFAFDTAGP